MKRILTAKLWTKKRILFKKMERLLHWRYTILLTNKQRSFKKLFLFFNIFAFGDNCNFNNF